MRDPNPIGTGPTKWRADHCTTHHHACDCREWEHACRIEQLEAALEAAREDAERYQWLRMMAKEQFLNPKAAGSGCPDMRTHWRIPTLICSGPVGGFIDFDAAIDQARGKGVADEA